MAPSEVNSGLGKDYLALAVEGFLKHLFGGSGKDFLGLVVEGFKNFFWVHGKKSNESLNSFSSLTPWCRTLTGCVVQAIETLTVCALIS